MFQMLVYTLESNTLYYQQVQIIVELSQCTPERRDISRRVLIPLPIICLTPLEGVEGRRLADWLGKELLHAPDGHRSV